MRVGNHNSLEREDQQVAGSSIGAAAELQIVNPENVHIDRCVHRRDGRDGQRAVALREDLTRFEGKMDCHKTLDCEQLRMPANLTYLSL